MQNSNFVKKAKIVKKIKYGNENYNNTEKRKETCLKKYGVENPVQNKEVHLKIENTLEEKTGYRFAMQNKETKEKAINTCFKHYGVENPTQDFVIRERQWATKKRNSTANTSKPEDEIASILVARFPDMLRNHKTNLYPFHCDFYIPSIDTYIEYQGHQGHGHEPYDPDNLKHRTVIAKW